MNQEQGKQHSVKCPAIGYEGKIVSPSSCRCDGFHTFEELYDHRITLFIALCKLIHKYEDDENLRVWRSKIHSDGSSFDGWFVLGINTGHGEQITYHLPDKLWDSVFFANSLDKAPDFDFHTPDDVIKRLKNI